MIQYLDFEGLQAYHEKLHTELDEMRDEYNSLILNCTQAEYEQAQEQGLIVEDMVVNITDDYDEAAAIEPITDEEINALFN